MAWLQQHTATALLCALGLVGAGCDAFKDPVDVPGGGFGPAPPRERPPVSDPPGPPPVNFCPEGPAPSCAEGSLAVIALPACIACDQDGVPACGLDMDPLADFLPAAGCALRDEPGELSVACTEQLDGLSDDAVWGNGQFDVPVEALGTSLALPGCCRLDGTCGLWADEFDLGPDLGIFSVGLGCQPLQTFEPAFRSALPVLPCVGEGAPGDGGADAD